MSDQPIKKQRRALARSKPDGSSDYEVGYAKPPNETRFKPGQSGNPHGRPKGRKNKKPALNEERLKDIILEEAYRDIKVNDGDQQVSVPMAQAVVRSLAVNAAKGNTHAQRLFAEMLTTTENSRMQLHNEWLETSIEYKVSWERELERRKQLGITGPEPLPHPDDIIVDFRNNDIEIIGPMSKEEEADWEFLRERKAKIQQEIVEVQGYIEDPKWAHTQDVFQKALKKRRKELDLIEQFYPYLG